MDYEFIGWCRDEEKNQDKVWIVLDLSADNVRWSQVRTYATVWGRRGKKLQHKVVNLTGHEMDSLIRRKRDKGYSRVIKTDLDLVYPEFEQDLEQTAVWAMLSA